MAIQSFHRKPSLSTTAGRLIGAEGPVKETAGATSRSGSCEAYCLPGVACKR